jgi:hypothetical protein
MKMNDRVQRADITNNNLTGYTIEELRKMYVAHMDMKPYCITADERQLWADMKVNLVAAQG